MARARARGQCVNCSEPAVPGRTRCAKHREQSRQAAAMRRQRVGQHKPAPGRCRNCGAKARRGRVLCAPCATKHGVNELARRTARKAAGLCVRCGNVAQVKDGRRLASCEQHSIPRPGKCSMCGVPVSNGKRRCEMHLAAAREREAQRRAERRRLGLCYSCDEPAARAGWCVAHYARELARRTP